MLEIRTNCENCNKSLPNDSDEAMICSFECTFCKECVAAIFYHVCPNCGGGFVPRPTRPSAMLQKYPVSTKIINKLIDLEMFAERLKKYKDIDPRKR